MMRREISDGFFSLFSLVFFSFSLFPSIFCRSAGRAGKPVVKWAELQIWFQNRRQSHPINAALPSKKDKEIIPSPDVSNFVARPDVSDPKKTKESDQGHKGTLKVMRYCS